MAAGCHAPVKDPRPASQQAAHEQLSGLSFNLAQFTELNDLWRALVQPNEETACLQVFEKGGVDLAVFTRPEGGIGYNALIIYTYDGVGKHYCPRVYWFTLVRGSNEVVGVHVAFDYQAGMIEARSPHGRFVFRASMSALAAKQPEELFGGQSRDGYPAFRTLEGLKAAAETDGALHVFEKDKMKVAVRVQSWGSAGWKGLIIYPFDEVANLWFPRVLWDSGAKDVSVTFAKRSGKIEALAKDGKLIFQTNIAALKARPNAYD
jgi:hypothetical protein